MFLRITRHIVLFVALLCLMAIPLRATSLMILSTGELTEKADVIVTGRISGFQCEWNNDKNLIYTYITVQVDEHLKGAAPDGRKVLVVKQLGGIMDGLQFFIPGMPRFEENEEVLLFLKPREVEPVSQEPLNYLVCGLAQGKFSIIEDPVSGQKILRNDLSDIMMRTEKEIPRATSGQSQTLGEFTGEINDILEK